MYRSKNRRDFLKVLAGGAGISLFPAAPRLWAQAAGGVGVAKLTDTISLVNGAGSNVVVVNAPDGVLMVDGGSPEHSADLLKLVCGDSPVSRVQATFNTHWHPE